MKEKKSLYLSNKDKIIISDYNVVFSFAGPRKVISSSPLGGGIRRNLTAVFNHCDRNLDTWSCPMLGNTYQEHLEIIADQLGLDPFTTSGLSTACPMEAIDISRKNIQGIPITIAITGGIEHNGRCAGDKASMWEENGKFQMIEENMATIPDSGTINILLHIDADLTDGALVGSVMVVTEAKAAIIQTLGKQSCYSSYIATGSGTDGIIIMANPTASRKITQVRTDTRLGEEIANSVKEGLAHSLMESEKIIRRYEELLGIRSD